MEGLSPEHQRKQQGGRDELFSADLLESFDTTIRSEIHELNQQINSQLERLTEVGDLYDGQFYSFHASDNLSSVYLEEIYVGRRNTRACRLIQNIESRDINFNTTLTINEYVYIPNKGRITLAQQIVNGLCDEDEHEWDVNNYTFPIISNSDGQVSILSGRKYKTAYPTSIESSEIGYRFDKASTLAQFRNILYSLNPSDQLTVEDIDEDYFYN